MAVTQQLIADACSSLGVTVRSILNDGGQKTVRIVERDDDTFVLKVIEVATATPDALQRAAREVALLNSIESDHVVKVRSELVELDDPPKGAAWLEEFLDGEDLSAHLCSRWSWGETRQMLIELAIGLSAMHRIKVTHRDLSPANVRKCTSGRYVVMDPGYARHALLPSITVAGHPGTLGYLSPEHLLAPPLGPTSFSDVFCMALLGYQALVGRPAIEFGGDVPDYVRRLNLVECPDLAVERPDLQPEVISFFRKCMHRQPARRYRDGEQVWRELEGM